MKRVVNSGLVTLIGIVLAAVTAPALFAVMSYRGGTVSASGVETLFIYGLIFSIPATVFLALPAYAVLLREGYASFWSIVASGFAIGAVVSFILSFGRFEGMLESAFLGGSSALVFWLTLTVEAICVRESSSTVPPAS